MCTGALHCQILDAIYPGKVPLHKVNFDAKCKHPLEQSPNYQYTCTLYKIAAQSTTQRTNKYACLYRCY